MAKETLEETIEETADYSLTNQEDEVSTCGCCSTSSPQPVSEVNVNSYTINQNALKLTVSTPNPADTTLKKVSIQVIDSDGADVAGRFNIRWKVVDSPSTPWTDSTSPPNGSPQTFDDVSTDATGLYELFLIHTGSGTWYVTGDLGDNLVTSVAVVFPAT